MKLVTERSLIKSVLERWERQYPTNVALVNGESSDHTRDKLRLLDLNSVSTSQVQNVIGNDSWTSDRCGECGGPNNCGVSVGDAPSLFICIDCMGKIADKWIILKELIGGGF